jgi:hypothetical protein
MAVTIALAYYITVAITCQKSFVRKTRVKHQKKVLAKAKD